MYHIYIYQTNSIDLRETTITLQTQKISRKSGESIKILLKKIRRFLDLREP